MTLPIGEHILIGWNLRGLRGIAVVAALAAGCTSSLSQRAKRIKWASGPGEILECEYLGLVEGSSMQSGSANADIGETNARHEALEAAVGNGATHILWRPTSYGARVHASGDSYDCSSSASLNAYEKSTANMGRDAERNDIGAEALKLSCDEGDAASCNTLGNAYMTGDSLPIDTAKAVRYLAKACKKDSVQACLMLGSFYERDDVEKNVASATHFFERACSLGSSRGCRKVEELGGADTTRVTTSEDGTSTGSGRHPAREDKPDDTESAPPKVEVFGLGTCFAISKDGLIATAAHVIAGAKAIGVQFNGEDMILAEVEKVSSATDLAILKVDRTTKRYLPVVAATKADLGDKVFTIGFPLVEQLGFEPKFSEGAVRSLSSSGEEHVMQLSVPVHEGNSGGAVVTETGALVAIVVMRINDKTFYEDTGSMAGEISFAVKAPYLAAMLDEKHQAAKPLKLKRKKAIKLVEESTCKVLTISDR